MIFQEILSSKGVELSSEMDRLFEVALQNQGHPNDLLLVYVNGVFNAEIIEWNKNRVDKLNPNVIGPGLEGHSENLHYKFIHQYRTTHISSLTYEEYLNELTWSKEKSDLIDALVESEEMTIQLEMLIYLKFWEADLVIKKFYELVRILNGNTYDWYFQIANSARDSSATGSRQDIIRLKIREQLKSLSPVLYTFFKDTYKTQIRNSIAHSNYSFLNRTIALNNFIKEDPASQLTGVSFEDWIDVFHNTIILHNEYVRFNNKINEYYGQKALENGGILPILITEQNGTQYELPLEYRQEFKDWSYLQN